MAVNGVENVHVESARVPRGVGMYLSVQYKGYSFTNDKFVRA